MKILDEMYKDTIFDLLGIEIEQITDIKVNRKLQEIYEKFKDILGSTNRNYIDASYVYAPYIPTQRTDLAKHYKQLKDIAQQSNTTIITASQSTVDKYKNTKINDKLFGTFDIYSNPGMPKGKIVTLYGDATIRKPDSFCAVMNIGV